MPSQVTVEVLAKILLRTPGVDESTKRVKDLNAAIHSTGREMYRYTFYAMWFAQVVNTYIGMKVVQAFLRPAGAMNQALARFRAFGDASVDQAQRMYAVAEDLAVIYPFTASEIVEAATEMARAGLEAEEAMEAVAAAAKIAALEGTSLAAAGTFVATAMRVFGYNAQQVNKVVDQVAYAASKSKYSFAEMRYALDMTMATAAGMHQTITELLTVLSALGMMGFPAAQAATMVNQIYARIGDRDTLEFFQAALDYVSSVPELAQTLGGGIPELFPPLSTGRWLGDLGEVMIASAQALRHAVENSLDDVEARIQAFQVMTSVFGVRNIRAFLALGAFEYAGLKGVAAYRKLKAEIEAAEGAAAKMWETLATSWYNTMGMISRGMNTFKTYIGSGMLAVLNPVARLVAEFTMAINQLLGMSSAARALTSSLLTLGTTLTAVAGIAGTFFVIFTLLLGKLRDIGSQAEVMAALATRFGGPKAVEAMSPAMRGFRYFLGPISGLMGFVRALIFAVGMGSLIWTQNLGGIRDRFKPQREALAKYMGAPGELAKRIADGVKAAFGEGTLLGGALRGLRIGFYGALSLVVRSLAKSFEVLYVVLSKLFQFMKALLKIPAWVVGLGDVEAGFRRLGIALQYMLIPLGGVLSLLAMAKATETIFGLARGGVRALQWLFVGRQVAQTVYRPGEGGVLIPEVITKTTGGILPRILRRIFPQPSVKGIFGRLGEMGTALFGRMKKGEAGWEWASGREPILSRIARFIGGETLGNLYKGLIGWLTESRERLDKRIEEIKKAWGIKWGITPLAKWLSEHLGKKSPFYEGLRKAVGEGYRSGGILVAIAKGLWYIAGKILAVLVAGIAKLLTALGAGGAAQTLSRLLGVGGAAAGGAAVAGKAGVFAVLAKLGIIGAILAALAGLGYGAYKLYTHFTRPREESGPTGYQPPSYATVRPTVGPVAPSYSTSVAFQPTIVVPQGTTEEQAQYIVERIKKEVPGIFSRITWEEQGRAREQAVRAYGLYAGA